MTTILFAISAFFFVFTVAIMAQAKAKFKYRIMMATPFFILALVFAKGCVDMAMM